MEPNKPILLVEDDRIDIMTIRRGLKRLDIENPLIVCYNGVEAMNVLTNSPPENLPALILLDLNLPKMNGFELLHRIKEMPIIKRIPVIVVTTSDAIKDKAVCYDYQIAGYFVKPLDYFNLLDSIMNYWKYSKLPPFVNE